MHFQDDPNESKDTDGDGIGDNADPDINNDGFPEGRVFVSNVLTPSIWRTRIYLENN